MEFKFTVKGNPLLEIEFEVGSLSEGVGILTDNAAEMDAAFRQMAALATGGGEEPATHPESNGDFPLTAEQIAANEEAQALGKTGPGRPKLTDRQKAANAAAKAARKAAGATPPPAPVTASAPPPIPPSLDRTKQAAPPPPAPAAPPPPAPAPNSALAQAVWAELDRRKGMTADNGGQLLGWLAHPSVGAIGNGATWAEAGAVIKLLDNAKLLSLAAALQVQIPA